MALAWGSIAEPQDPLLGLARRQAFWPQCQHPALPGTVPEAIISCTPPTHLLKRPPHSPLGMGKARKLGCQHHDSTAPPSPGEWHLCQGLCFGEAGDQLDLSSHTE